MSDYISKNHRFSAFYRYFLTKNYISFSLNYGRLDSMKKFSSFTKTVSYVFSRFFTRFLYFSIFCPCDFLYCETYVPLSLTRS